MIKDDDIHTDDTDHRTALARKVFKFMTDAPDQESLIRFADSLSEEYTGQGLDSLDIGDALGFFLSYAESEEYAGNNEFGEMMIPGPGFTITITTDWDLFQWGIGKFPPGPFDHIDRQMIEDAFRNDDNE